LQVFNHKQQSRVLNHYFLGSWFVMLFLISGYLAEINWDSGWAITFSLAVYFSYAAIYLLPAYFLTTLFHRLLVKFQSSSLSRTQTILVNSVAIILVVFTNVLIYADGTVFTIFGFHLNGFVWNLVTTPGGIDSMGGGGASYISVALILTGILLTQLGWMLVLNIGYGKRLAHRHHTPLKIYRYLMVVFFILTLSERASYVMGDIYAYGPVYTTASAFPFYKQTKFRTLADWLDIEVKKRNELKASVESGVLKYPLQPLKIEAPAKPLNIIWLVAESLRWDMLDKSIMPASWSFSKKAHRFTRQYSGGIGTRMGMFSMFYGLYGPYWNQFLAERRSPVLIDVLREQDYQLEMFTSAKFSYPEFDKTIFSHIPEKHLHQDARGEPPERDRINIDRMISFMENRDKKRPFMTFMFFESTHARYYYPEKNNIRDVTLDEINYLTMSRESLAKDIDQIKNRYINASHYVDIQIGRLLNYLKKKKLIENTIVIITGDHGEEFMEKGRWGHNSDFVEEQIRAPLVLWIPGSGSSVVESISSHMDIIPTILPWLGVKNDASDYSQGYNLLGQDKRPYAVVSDWDRIAYIGPEYKYSIPYKRGALYHEKVKDKNDKIISDDAFFFAKHQQDLLKIITGMKTFRAGNSKKTYTNKNISNTK